MFLPILSVLLLAQQDTAQQTQHKGDKTGHGVESSPAEYRTNFSCVGRVAGYYADITSGCQLYHMCDPEGRRFTHACPKETLFQQRMMICDHWYMVNCNNSEHDYSANLLIGQHDKPFMSPEEHLHHHTPVYFFTTQQNPGSLQQPYRFPEVTNQAQQHSRDNNNTVSNSEHLRDQIPVDYQLHNESASSRPSTSRRSRNRNINKSQPHASNPPKSTSGNVAATQRLVVNEYSGRDSLPAAYTDNPFFQSLLLRTIPPTPQTIAYISNHSDNSQAPNNSKAQYNEHKTFTESQMSDELQDLVNFGIPSTRALPQQSLPSRTKEFSNYLGITTVHNLPASLTEQKVPDTYDNNSFFQSLTKTRKLLVSTSTMPHSTEQRATTQTNINVNENEDDSNNIVQLHLLDPRRMFFIPESNEDIADSGKYNFETGNMTVLFVSVPVYSHNHGQIIMNFRHDDEVIDGRNMDCPRCHPHFLLPGRCQPCVIIR